MADDRVRLTAGSAELGLTLSPQTLDRMIAFRDLLARWNRVYNLTAVRDPRAMIERHLLDSLTVAPYLQGLRCLDVGTGAGLPGIPLALAVPERHFTLVDSQAKRIRFLRQVAVELEIPNVEIVHSRVEEFQPEQRFDTVVSRAFSRLDDFVALAGRLCASNGQLLAMKGAKNREEWSLEAGAWVIDSVFDLHVPGLAGERHLVCVRSTVKPRADDPLKGRE